MKKGLRILLKTSVITICTLIVLMVVAAILLNTDSMQNKIMQYAVGALKEDLKTEVSIGHVSVDVRKQHVNLHKLTVDDRSGRKMLQMENLAVGFDLHALLHKEIVVTKAQIDGLKAFLYKQAPDSTANYQFLIDAFKSKKSEQDSMSTTKKHPLKYKLGRATIDIDTLCYITDNGQPVQDANNPNGKFFDAGHLNLQAGMLIHLKDIDNDQFKAELSRCYIKNKGVGKKEAKIHLAANVTYKAKDATIDIDTLEYFTNNGQPRQDLNKPYSKFIDPGHLNLQAGMRIHLKDFSKDQFKAELSRCHVKNHGSGKKVAKIHLAGKVNYKAKKASIDIDTLGYVTNNGLPRRNTGKPRRGAFDAGHLNLLLKAHVDLSNIDKEGFDVTVTNCSGVDSDSGLKLTGLQLKGKKTNEHLQLSNIVIRLPKTKLTMASADIMLPKKSIGRKLSYHTPMLKGTTQLKDISQAFAPTLKDFVVPLQLQCSVSGDDDNMHFGNVRVGTTDQQLHIEASGNIDHLKGKHLLHVHFDVDKMTALKGTPERIINQFQVKKFMMKQLNTLGHIEYKGQFDVLWRKETFSGILNTEMGAMNVDLEIDDQNKYLIGSVSTDDLQLGQAIGNKQLGKIVSRARFKFDISKVRTGQMRKEKGGKLPIGNVEAEVLEGHYSHFSVHNVSATINSDGAVASGMVVDHGNFIDLSCSFSFTDTNDMEKIHIKPGISLHRKNKDVKNYAIEKEKKEQEKLEKKAKKEQEKKEEKEKKELEKKEKKEKKELEKKEKRERKEQAKKEKKEAQQKD